MHNLATYHLSLLLIALPLITAPAGEVVTAKNGMVVCVSPEATDVGVQILKQGGNAVDASISVALAMAVTYPAAGNIGGGGFMMVWPGEAKPPVCIEYRETSPAAVKKETLANDPNWLSHRAVGVPGTIRGMELAHQRFGKLPWKVLVQPAIELAENGFVLDASMVKSLQGIVTKSKEFPELVRCLGKDGGQSAWKVGDRLVQKDLAATLRIIAEEGPAAFYRGKLAEQLVAEMKAGGGFITLEDLAAYQAKERIPIHGTYRGYDVYGPPPPSSGGTVLVEMLNILENFELAKHPRHSAITSHLLAEAMRRSYLDRARYLGDPDFTKIPAHLTTKEHAKRLAAEINPQQATKSETLATDIKLTPESDSTTHFSVIDAQGMAVSNTYTLEASYGSRVMVRGGGYLLNNEMGDFNTKPGVTNRLGTIGTEANQIAPGKRMLSSQSPTLIAKDGKLRLVVGSPGGRTIINTVLCIVVNHIDYGMEVQAAVDAPRQHHQWFPDVLKIESKDKSSELIEQLQKLGHRVEKTAGQGDGHSIAIDPQTGLYLGAADKRINGKAAGW